MGYGDDIVHALKQFKDKCNEWVVGSNPTCGAQQRKQYTP